jgi:hypothetical protein
VAAAISFCPVAAHADAIIPYMVVPWGQVFLLPLVVIVEAVVLWRMLRGRFLSALGQSFVANLASTVLGAGLYFATMAAFGEPLFYWWFKGGFATKTVRNACIALGFAVALWFVSWIVESLVVARMRKVESWRIVLIPCAIANLVTYVGLLALALLYQR